MEERHAKAIVRFESYRLHLGEERLLRGDDEVHLTAKAYAVLRYLVTHAGQLIARDTLFNEIWGTQYVTEAALAACIREIRRALEDRAQQPLFVETVRGRGFRFVASVISDSRSPASEQIPEPQSPVQPQTLEPQALPSGLVDREGQLAQLLHHVAASMDGARQIVLVSGEAGIGKTSLVDALVGQVTAQSETRVSYGQCLDQFGEGEAYLPLLEALGQLLRGPDRQGWLDGLKQYAPSWLLQLPAFVSDAELESVQRRASGATRERMLRELAEVVETLTMQRALVLVLEDLHWSDSSTLDWLSYIARRRQPARLLILGTYRPVDAVVRDHPVRAVAQELRAHGWGHELALDYLSEVGVGDYLSQRFDDIPISHTMVSNLYHRTNGNPLFLVTLVDELVRQGGFRHGETGWEVTDGLPVVEVSIPAGLQQLITQQLEQISSDEQRLIEAASVAGRRFPTAAIAELVGQSVEDVEDAVEHLARQGRFVQADGAESWMDGTFTSCYQFVHDLYRETAYSQVPLGRLARWHRQIGMRLEVGYGMKAHEIATELARHFISGQDTPRAVTYLFEAGVQAVRRAAYNEAIRHLQDGLDLIPSLADGPDRDQRELAFLNELAPQILAVYGCAAFEVEHTYRRIRELTQRIGEGPDRSQALWGLQVYHFNRPSYETSLDIAWELYALAQETEEPIQQVEANQAVGVTLVFMGRPTEGLQYLQEGCAIYETHGCPSYALSRGREPGLQALTPMALVLAGLGYLDQALEKNTQSLTLAESFDHPFSSCWVSIWGAVLHIYRREHERAHELAQRGMSLATEHQFVSLLLLGQALYGWVIADQGDVEAGIAQMQQGLEHQAQAGQGATRTIWHYLLAETYGKAGDYETGLRVLEEGLETVEKNGERCNEAELYRLRGDLLSAQPNGNLVEAMVAYRQALTLARAQQAKLWELRAAVGLARLWLLEDKRQEAHDVLDPVYSWFTEGFETADLQDAQALLQSLRA